MPVTAAIVSDTIQRTLSASLSGSGGGCSSSASTSTSTSSTLSTGTLATLEWEHYNTYTTTPPNHTNHDYLLLSVTTPTITTTNTSSSDSSSSGSASPCSKPKENGLPKPKKVFYPVSNIALGLKPDWKIGAGMINVGNTCYLNSTLQALFHAPAFANWLIGETKHAENCYQNSGCIICGMKKTLQETQQNSGGSIKPWQVYSKLRLICRHLQPGNQEDAHEFLRYLVESMEKAYLSQFGPAVKQLDQYSKETTPLNQILGGYLRSAVRCLACGHVSTTFQHFQDLLVDARKANSLDEALDSFFSRERLEDLGYKCESCNKKVSATKQFFIERAPMVLCIALKRFSVTGGKLSKHVPFKLRISMKKYMSNSNNHANLSYRLVSVVTHLGMSQNCGHYTAIGLGPENTFYQFDDSSVRPLSTSSVLGTNVYIMFYELEKQTPFTNGSKANLFTPMKSLILPKQQDSGFIGPVLPDSMKQKISLKMNCSIEKSPITEKPEGLKMSNGHNLKPSFNKTNGHMNGNGNIKLNRSFNGNSYSNGSSSSSSNHAEPNDKPTNGDSPKVQIKSSVVNGDSNVTSKTKLCLVPYDSESENQDDEEDTVKPIKQSDSNGVTKATTQGWKVSSDGDVSQLSPSLNGVVNNKIIHTTAADNNNTEHSSQPSEKEKDVANVLKRFSHTGYGSQVSTWNETHSQLNRQVFEEKKNMLKRSAEADDEIDHGRAKKVRYNNYNPKFNNSSNSNNSYNPFQDHQNQRVRWSHNNHSGKGRHFYNNNRNFKYRPRGRFNQHYSNRNHSSNNRHHHHNNHNRSR